MALFLFFGVLVWLMPVATALGGRELAIGWFFFVLQRISGGETNCFFCKGVKCRQKALLAHCPCRSRSVNSTLGLV